MLFFTLSRGVVGFIALSLLVYGATSGTVKIYRDINLKELVNQNDFRVHQGCQPLPDIAEHSRIFVLTDICLKLYQSSSCTTSGKALYIRTNINYVQFARVQAGFRAFESCSSKTYPTLDMTTLANATNPNVTAQLHANIFQSVISEQVNDARKQTTLNILPQSIVQNHQTGELSAHKYEAKITIQEFIKIQRPSWVQNFTTVEPNQEVRFEEADATNQFGPYVNDVGIQSHIEKTFTRTSVNSTFYPEYSVVESKTFSAEETVPVASCRRYTFASSLVVNYWPFWLESRIEVTGIDVDGKRIPAEILKDMLPNGLWYEDSWDEYSVIVSSLDTFKTQYGDVIETNINENVIPNC